MSGDAVILPLVGQGSIIAGASQMFAHIQETGSVFGMTGFLVLALIVGPVMEEVILALLTSKWVQVRVGATRSCPVWGYAPNSRVLPGSP